MHNVTQLKNPGEDGKFQDWHIEVNCNLPEDLEAYRNGQSRRKWVRDKHNR